MWTQGRDAFIACLRITPDLMAFGEFFLQTFSLQCIIISPIRPRDKSDTVITDQASDQDLKPMVRLMRFQPPFNANTI
jgi:hypothetical protein